MNVTQREFNAFVRMFNRDYMHVLGRAAAGVTDGSILALFTCVVDAHELVNKMHALGGVEFEIPLSPFSLNCDPGLLAAWGFSPGDVRNIESFLERYRRESGRAG